MRIRQVFHTVIHKGLYQPRSHRKKRDYKIGDIIGQLAAALFLSFSLPNAYKRALYTGVGSFGNVKTAIRLQDQLPVAIKVIPKDKVNYSMVYSEMAVLEGIDHPNVLQFYDWFESR